MIHKNIIKFADFGNSYLQGSGFYAKPCGVKQYLDPKIFESNSYIFTEKSDIYNLGMILQELTGGKFVRLCRGKYKTIV